MDRAAAGRGGAGIGGGGGEAVAVDGGADQDDVLGVDQARRRGRRRRRSRRCRRVAPPGAAGPVMTARTPPGRSTRSQAANTRPGSCPAPAPPPGCRPQQPGPQQPATASPAVPAAGSPGGGSAAGTPGRCRAGAGPGMRARTRRPAAAAASMTAGEPPAAATRSPGRENASMTRRAAATVTGPPHGRPSRASPGAGRPGQMLSGTPGPVPPAARLPAAVVSGAGPAGWPSPAVVEGLCHGGWSRVPPLSALTLHKSGFRGLFSRARRRNIRAARITREISPEKSLRGFAGTGAALYHRPCTSRVPAMYLAGAVQVSALMYLAGDGGPARAADGPPRAGRRRAGAGTCQVHGRYMPGARQAGARYIAGTRQVNRGWLDGASFPSASADLELSHG